eukprot:TRINITY_DN41165_c0_g1_i1.p1 TRINITY_DN41165_c0_g1~~TRINITY_DN41165_c0_g1_i1.p1  ORF type:complete len:168 (-),score=12.77 TRINITY_DN41165_c0_g1_i1:91-594(-)
MNSRKTHKPFHAFRLPASHLVFVFLFNLRNMPRTIVEIEFVSSKFLIARMTIQNSIVVANESTWKCHALQTDLVDVVVDGRDLLEDFAATLARDEGNLLLLNGSIESAKVQARDAHRLEAETTLAFRLDESILGGRIVENITFLSTMFRRDSAREPTPRQAKEVHLK